MNETGSRTVRQWRPEDKSDIVALLESGFSLQNPEGRFDWIYQRNPAGPALVWVVYDRSKDELAGMNVFFPWRMVFQGEEVTAAQNGDAIVDAAYRRQGVFTSLGEQAVKRGLSENGIAFAYGFPNKAALPGHRKIGCIEVGAIETVFWPFTKGALAELPEIPLLSRLVSSGIGAVGDAILKRKTLLTDSEVVCRQVLRFDQRADDLWLESALDYPIVVVRDQRYLNWKYADRPDREYTILVAERGNILEGYVVLENKGSRVAVLDILSRSMSYEVICALTSAAVQFSKDQAASIIYFQALEGNPCLEALRRYGFLPMPKTSSNAFIAYPGSSNVPDAFFGNPANWFVTKGDQD